jgi:hypothetical protein
MGSLHKREHDKAIVRFFKVAEIDAQSNEEQWSDKQHELCIGKMGYSENPKSMSYLRSGKHELKYMSVWKSEC